MTVGHLRTLIQGLTDDVEVVQPQHDQTYRRAGGSVQKAERAGLDQILHVYRDAANMKDPTYGQVIKVLVIS